MIWYNGILIFAINSYIYMFTFSFIPIFRVHRFSIWQIQFKVQFHFNIQSTLVLYMVHAFFVRVLPDIIMVHLYCLSP